jgi:hypothetical protein
MPIDRIKIVKRDLKSFFFKTLAVVATFLIFSACTSGKPTETQSNDQKGSGGVSTTGPAASSGREQFSVEITPKDATRRTNISLIPKGFNISDAKIEWLADGVAISGANAYILSAASIKKGSVVKAKVNVKGREFSSNEIVIKNSPPEITAARFQPSGNTLGVDVAAEDADGDNVTLVYAWSVNEKPAGTDKTVGIPVKRGDKISVKITPSDGESDGRAVVLSSEARNMPPVLSDQRDIKFYGNLWTCQLKSSDHDGDPVTFVLKSGPQGMAIDPNTGLLTWQVPADFKGKTSCVVAVKDVHGGESSYNVDVDIGR